MRLMLFLITVILQVFTLQEVLKYFKTFGKPLVTTH